MTIDISKNHMDKNLQWYKIDQHNFGETGVPHETYSQSVVRSGRWSIAYYSVWKPNVQTLTPLKPFSVSYPSEFNSKINF
jgi:hypothetical protein